VLALLVSCGRNTPEPPDPAAYQKLDAEGRIKATTPRAVLCINHLMYEDAVSAGLSREEAKEIMQRASDKPSRPEDDEVVYKTQCLGEPNANALPDAVLACWKIEDCKQFANCVTDKRKR
jgi:isopentenyldiphosphate isomerase